MKDDQFNKRRWAGSYFISVLSIGLVLLSLGLLGLVFLHAQQLSVLIRENITFEIIMNGEAKEANILQFQKVLDASPSVKSTQYITREEATKQLATELGEDFIHWLGEDENPLLPSIEVKFNAAWANNDSLAVIDKQLSVHKDVKEVYYQQSLIHLINQNIQRIGFALSVFSILLLVIATALINNTIRLAVYARRFRIRSMQLVGATEPFIRKPFLMQAIGQGFIGGTMAILLLIGLLYLLTSHIPELLLLQNIRNILLLFVALLILGILLTIISTYVSLNKYLRAKTDKLFV
ncbi:MAG: permease-like cell division protein FtsX [Bacteroidales bacterium]|jgi:cell division transport system permease protein|nr:permease-like cell division protein FtsX [Bacteroidales bacterium]MDD3700039.1 permease-like cell division protein FtsX [Bacteroidales bacterium]MDY0368811.1 permease-like cell division protein FtsX [Bacteroidales bacterium]